MTGCFNCGGTDHWKDTCPVAARAATYEEHLARIETAVSRWVDGELTINAKRAAITQENLQWYGPECPRRLLWP